MTRAEALLWTFIRRRAHGGVKFRRQPIGPYIADFACAGAMLVVEVDGETHQTPEQLAYDAQRTRYLESKGWRVLRVTNADVYKNMDGVWLAIDARISPPAVLRRAPPLAGEE
jgi:very-short-patch-repair endonuclease